MSTPKIIIFQDANRKEILKIPVHKDNDLVLGLIYQAMNNRSFDCNNENFRMILNELIEEYKALQRRMLDTTKEIPPEFTKLVIGVNDILRYMLDEINSEKPSEIKLSRYIRNTLEYTNAITRYVKEPVKAAETKKIISEVVVPTERKKITPQVAKAVERNDIVQSAQHNMTILERMRNWNPLRKWMLAVGLVSALGGGTMAAKTLQRDKDVDTSKNRVEVKAETKAVIPEKTKVMSAKEINVNATTKAEAKLTDMNAPIDAPPGYQFMFAQDAAIITAYTPTGEGLMPGINPDGTAYKETGRTATNFDATKNFDGVAVDPRVIPYGALIYIDGVGWKIADDTGGRMRRSWRKHKRVHIDIRVPQITQDVLDKTGEKKIYVFKNMSKKDYDDRVREARKGFQNEDSKIFKHINSSP